MKLILVFFLIFPALTYAETTLTMGMSYRYSRNQAINEYLDFLKSTMKDAGYKVVVKTYESKRTYDMVVEGAIQASPYDDLAIKDGRDKVVTVSFPIIYAKGRIFYRADNKSFNPKKLKNYKGALSQNNAYIDKEAKEQSLKFITTSGPFQSIQVLLEGKVDYFLAIEEVGKAAIASTPEAIKQIKMSDEVFKDIPIYFTLQKSFKKDLPKIEAAFKKHLQGDLSKYPLIKNVFNTSAQ